MVSLNFSESLERFGCLEVFGPLKGGKNCKRSERLEGYERCERLREGGVNRILFLM